MEELADKYETLYNYCSYFLDRVRYIMGRHFINTVVPKNKDAEFIENLNRILNLYILDTKDKYILFSDAITTPSLDDDQNFPQYITTTQWVVEYRFDDINVEDDQDNNPIDPSIKALQDYYIQISANRHNIHWNIIVTDPPEPHTQILQENLFKVNATQQADLG